jgi:hypothetical protein
MLIEITFLKKTMNTLDQSRRRLVAIKPEAKNIEHTRSRPI